MQKRTERNKRLYEEVNAIIAEMEKKKLNKDFEDSNKTLQEINPALFGGKEKETTKKKSKKNLIVAIVIVVIIILIISLAVGIYYGTK